MNLVLVVAAIAGMVWMARRIVDSALRRSCEQGDDLCLPPGHPDDGFELSLTEASLWDGLTSPRHFAKNAEAKWSS